MAKILVVDDDDSLASMLKSNLKLDGYTVDIAYNCAFARELIRDNKFDVLVLDVDLPDGLGYELCQQYRDGGGQNAVLMLTGHHEIEAKEKAFSSGADDYLTKPFDYKEIAMRLKALLRRAPLVAANAVTIGNLLVDFSARLLYRDGKPVRLNRLDFNLLEFFLKHPNTVLSQERILTSVWASYTESGADALRTAIKRIRKGIDVPGQDSLIESVYGAGYLFRLTKP